MEDVRRRAVEEGSLAQQRYREVASKYHVKRVIVAVAMAAFLLAACTGGGIVLLLSTPVLLLLSPVLVPLAILLTLAVAAFLSFVAFLFAVTWVYRYVKGGHPVGSNTVNAIKRRLANVAFHLTQGASRKGADIALNLQNRLHDAAASA